MTGAGNNPQPRIVVGVDESAASIAALHWAVRRARLTGCAVEVVHAWAASVSPFDLAHAQAGFQSERRAARDLLHTAVARAHDADPDGAVPVRDELVAGNPAAVLLERARGARMVVVGVSRHRGLTGIMRKTVTHALTKDAPCRVVIVADDGSVVSDIART